VVETPDTIREGKKPAKSIAPTQATTFIPDMFTTEKDGPTKLTVPPPPTWAFPDVLFEYGEPFECSVCYTEQKVRNKNAWK
jgi:hypothetical protein